MITLVKGRRFQSIILGRFGQPPPTLVMDVEVELDPFLFAEIDPGPLEYAILCPDDDLVCSMSVEADSGVEIEMDEGPVSYVIEQTE